MKQIYFKPILAYVLLIAVFFIIACTDMWDEHYDEESYDLPDKTLNEYIRDYPDISIFSGMLKKTGYDKILDASQSYTIWAPINNALNSIDTTNLELVQEIVENHIARSRYTTSDIENQSIRMLNGKYNNFVRESSGFSFGENTVIDPNLPAINGLIHVIDGYTPYINNLWEFIGRTGGLDSLRSYLYSQSENIFDVENSIEVGVDTNGNVVYDSAFIYSNLVLQKIGAIDTEDSIFTAIMPDNTAWNEAYGRIESFFYFPDDAGSVQRQRELTQYTLVKDMLFHGRINQPETLDSLVSTTGNVFYNPSNLFSNTEQINLSNGISYVTSQMPFIATQSWFKEIRVEAEEPEERYNENSNIFLRYESGSNLKVSDEKYILVDPISAEPSVTFSIPNTLSAKYNIYCVFVPATIVNPTDTTPTKVKFRLSYIRLASGSVSSKTLTPDNNITSPDGITKMLVDQFEFEYANIVDEDYERVAVKLKVINDVTTEEDQSGEFSRTMRIDCIIFEPVLE